MIELAFKSKIANFEFWFSIINLKLWILLLLNIIVLKRTIFIVLFSDNVLFEIKDTPLLIVCLRVIIFSKGISNLFLSS